MMERLLDELEVALDAFEPAPGIVAFERCGVIADEVRAEWSASPRALPPEVVDRYARAALEVSTAVHEGAHVVVGAAVRHEPFYAAIEANGRGVAVFLCSREGGLVNRAARSLAGARGERLLWRRLPGVHLARFRHPNLGGNSFPGDDLESAIAACGEGRLLRVALETADELVEQRWSDIVRVADALLVDKVLGIDRLEALLREPAEAERDTIAVSPSCASSVLQKPKG